MFNNNNNFPFRGVLGQMPAAPTFQPVPRTMFSGGAGVRGNMGGEMNFGQFGSQGLRAGYPGLPADFGYTPPWMVGGPGKNLGGMSNLGFNTGVGRGLGTTGGQGMNNFPGILSGGFNRRGF